MSRQECWDMPVDFVAYPQHLHDLPTGHGLLVENHCSRRHTCNSMNHQRPETAHPSDTKMLEQRVNTWAPYYLTHKGWEVTHTCKVNDHKSSGAQPPAHVACSTKSSSLQDSTKVQKFGGGEQLHHAPTAKSPDTWGALGSECWPQHLIPVHRTKQRWHWAPSLLYRGLVEGGARPPGPNSRAQCQEETVPTPPGPNPSTQGEKREGGDGPQGLIQAANGPCTIQLAHRAKRLKTIALGHCSLFWECQSNRVKEWSHSMGTLLWPVLKYSVTGRVT